MFGDYGVLAWVAVNRVLVFNNEIVFYNRQLRENGKEKMNMVFNSTDGMNNTNQMISISN